MVQTGVNWKVSAVNGGMFRPKVEGTTLFTLVFKPDQHST